MNPCATVRSQHTGILRALLPALLVLWPSERAAAAAPPPRIHCVGDQLTLDLEPLGTGPLALGAVYCQEMRSSPFPLSAPVVSPDGRAIAYFDHDTVLRVARLDSARAWTDYQADLGTFAKFGSDIRSIPAFTWDSNSQFLWTATHESVRSSGFAKTPMQAVRTADDGRLQPLPPLQHAAGPLDALLWADGDGLAVAQFGTRGEFYRPKHDDPSSTLAIADAAHGRVLDTLPFAALEPLRERARGTPAYVLVRNAAATTLPDGRVRALLRVGQWVVWTQGEAPRAMPDPYADEIGLRMVLSPDGSRVLVGRLLRTKGSICYRANYGCEPGRAVEGILAAVHDLGTGQALWTIRATATADYEFPTPAISQNGRYALVGLMPADARPLIALVFMDDGKIVQTFPSPGGNYAMGFVRGGRGVWTHAYGVTALYDLNVN
jgi:hypothetical protein